jgi:hypothetical protein
MRSLKHAALVLVLLTSIAEANALSIGKYYSVDEIKEFSISYDPKADIGLGSDLRLDVEARLKNGKVKPFTRWSKVSVEVQGGKKIRLHGKDFLRVAPDLEQVEDHKVHISIALKDNPKIQGSATIALNYRGATRVNFDGASGPPGTRGHKGASWGQWHGGDGGDGQPGRDGESAQDVVVHIRHDPELVDGHQLVRVTARTADTEREYLFNAAGGSLLVSANGGSGGAGGEGGSGGRGNNGKMNGDQYRQPGRGGNGGSGSVGGDGGSGGNITVFLHPDCQSLHEEGAIKFAAAAGAPGVKGKAGKGGKGGDGNRTNGPNRAGQTGNRGRDGASGRAGNTGAISVNIQETPDWTIVNQPEDVRPSADHTLFAVGQRWVGQYFCGQGQTDLELQITEVDGQSLSAVFDFTVSAQISGSFRIHGEYEPATRRITFRPGDWISRPGGYGTVGLKGHLDQNGSMITGEIDEPSCSTFAVSKR